MSCPAGFNLSEIIGRLLKQHQFGCRILSSLNIFHRFIAGVWSPGQSDHLIHRHFEINSNMEFPLMSCDYLLLTFQYDYTSLYSTWSLLSQTVLCRNTEPPVMTSLQHFLIQHDALSSVILIHSIYSDKVYFICSVCHYIRLSLWNKTLFCPCVLMLLFFLLLTSWFFSWKLQHRSHSAHLVDASIIPVLSRKRPQ